MGWWKIKDVESGQIDWEYQSKTSEDLYNGDGPADMMAETLDKINALYIKSWGRPAKRDELLAVFNFCANEE